MKIHPPLHLFRRTTASSSSPGSGFPPRPLPGSPEDPAPVRDLPAFLTEAGFPPPASVAPYGWTSPWLAKVAQTAVLRQYALAMESLKARDGEMCDRLSAGRALDHVRAEYDRELLDPEPVQ